VLRLIAAWVLTLTVLPYAWGRTAIIWMLVGRPETEYALMLLAGIVTVMVLTRGLAVELGRSWLDRLVAWGVPLTWVAWTLLLLQQRTGPLLPWWWVAVPFVPATLWVVWLSWMFYRPRSGRTRWGMTALLVLLLGGGLTLKVEGLTGNSNVNFAWRTVKPNEVFLSREASGAADLTRTTADDYAQYLGPQRLGVVPHARLARDWERRPPRLLWKKPVGAGWGAFAVVGEYAFTQEQRGDEECTVCYRVSDGTTAWVHADRTRFDSSMGGPGPRATPTVAASRVYAVGATGLLNCLDGATGRSLWSINILYDNQGQRIDHGVCGSPLLVDDLVVVCPTGNDNVTLAAYHRDTGKRVWQGGGQAASYGSPLLAELGGTRQVLIYGAAGVAGHDPASGKALWSFPWTNTDRINCSQPWPNAGGPGQIFAGTGYNKGSTLVHVERSPDGDWSCRPLWNNRRLKTKFTSAVLHDNYLYGLDEGILQCLDVKTGKQMWKDGRYEHGQVLLAGDLLLIQAESGDIALVEASPQGFHELGRTPALDGKTWNQPALAGKYLLVRNDHEAACLELAREE
jgi:outer membrane protein assembly factor BamB